MAEKAVNLPENSPENQNKSTVTALYNALAGGDTGKVAGVLASDLEYWFHGPQNCHHMMKMLTGESSPTAFRFEPRSVSAIGERVIAEGYDGASVYWVHVWTLKDELITQFREYFNTWLTVKELRPVVGCRVVRHDRSTTLWQSQPRDLFRRSLPGLMLAI